MKLFRFALALLLTIQPLFAQIPLGETYTVHMYLSSPTTGDTTTADTGAGPRCDVFRDASTSPVAALGSVATPLSGLTTSGGYLWSAVVSGGNGFAVGDIVNIDCHAVVGGVSGSVAKATFRLVATEGTTGTPVADATRINNVSTSSVTTINANQGTTQPLNFTGTGSSALVKGDVVDIAGSAVSTSTAQLGVNVVSTSADAITATSIQASAIGASEIAADAIGASEIAADAIGASELATDAIGAAEIASAAIAADEIAADAIGASEIATDAIGAAELAADSITSSEIADDSIDAGAIATDAITATELAANSITSSEAAQSFFAEFFTGDSGTTFASAVGGSVVKEIADNSATTATLAIRTGTADSGTTTTMVDAALTEADNDYWKGNVICFTSSTIDDQCRMIEDFVAATDTITFSPATTQAVSTHNYAIYPAWSVWDSTIADHLGSGTTGESLNAAGAGGDPWTTAVPGAYSAGQAGYILGTNLNATITSRASQTSLDTLDDFVDTEVAAIKAKTDNLPSDPADDSDIDSQLAAINAKTTNLPADPADASDIAGEFALLQVLQSGVAYADFPIFIRQTNTAATGVTSATVTCQFAKSTGSDYSAFGVTGANQSGITNMTEVGSGYYQADFDSSVIGNTTIIRCQAAGGSAAADPFITVIFGQR